jgi:hypothetical protein
VAQHRTAGFPVAIALLALVACLVVPTSQALGLATEHFGNDPVPPGFIELGQAGLDLANLPSRFYWNEVNGNPTFFYRGDADALNAALKKFGALPGDARELILVPGPGEGHTLGGEKRIGYDWWVNLPAGLHRPGPPTMTLYCAAASPAKGPDAKQLDRWLADLDSDSFEVRDRAGKELEKLGHAAAPALRKAIAGKTSPEARHRIEVLLRALSGIDLRDVKVPAGVTVLEVADLLARYREQLKGQDGTARGFAASWLGGLAPYTDVVPDLVAVLKDDKHEYARRSAAGALSRMGKKAAPALPILKEGLNDPDVNVRNAYEYAVKQIESANEEKPDEKRAARLRVLMEGISEYRKGLPADAKK